MSDIPDWLRELATESGQEESLEEGLPEEGEVDDTAVPDPTVSGRSPSAVDVTPSDAPEDSRPQSGDQYDLDMMEELRSQVDAEEEETESSSEGSTFSLDAVLIEGLEPVQQFVLAVLLFLDVVVIGLLFLVMLGRISI